MKFKEVFFLSNLSQSNTWGPILKSVSAGSANRILSLCIRLFTIPLVINYLGTEQFGVWIAISSIAGYIAMLDMGIGSAMVSKLTRLYASNKNSIANLAITNILAFLFLVAIVGMASTLIGLPLINWPKFLKLHTEIAINSINQSLVIAGIIFFLQIPFSLIQKIPYTMQKGYITELYILLGNVISLLGIFFGTYYGFGLPFLIIFINAYMLFSAPMILVHLLCVKWVVLRFDYLKYLTFSVCDVWKEALNFFVMQITGTLMMVLPVSVITYYHGAEALVSFGILMQVLMIFQIPLTLLIQPMWAKMTELVALNNINEVRSLYKVFIKISAIYSILTTLCFLYILNPLFEHVLNNNFQINTYLLLLFAIWCTFGLLFGGGASALVISLGLTREISRISIFQFIVYVVALFSLVPVRMEAGAVESIIISYIFSTPFICILIYKSLYHNSSKFNG